MINKTVNVIIPLVEGYTEVEFYKEVRRILLFRYSNKNENYEFLSPINIKGIGNYKVIASRQFENAVKKHKKDKKNISNKSKRSNPNNKIKYVYHAFMCIDTDVLDSSMQPTKFIKSPPINEKETLDSIKNKNGIPHFIKAVYSIEDWFLEDKNGILKYLKIHAFPKLNNNKSGAENLTAIFKKGNKIYTKGGKSDGFIDCLDVKLILHNHSNEFNDLIELLNV